MAFATDSSSHSWSVARDLMKSVIWAPAMMLSSLNFFPPPKGTTARNFKGFWFMILMRFGWRFMVSCFMERVTRGKATREKVTADVGRM